MTKWKISRIHKDHKSRVMVVLKYYSDNYTYFITVRLDHVNPNSHGGLDDEIHRKLQILREIYEN